MPISDKQLAANRANAAKSHGPTTLGGRRNSSQNAITHGMFANSALLDGENRKRFLHLLASLTNEFEATTPYELALVETMAMCRWRVMRSWTHQAAHANREQRLQTGPVVEEDPPTRSVLALQTADHPNMLENLTRLEVRFDREYHRSADRLMRLKAKKSKTEPSSD